MKRVIFSLAVALLAVMMGCSQQSKVKLITAPPMGWNSFDSYGVYLYHDAAVRNMEKLAADYKPYGYDLFCIDAGWFSEYELQEGSMIPKGMDIHSRDLNIDEFGRLNPSKTYFPQGLKVLADKAHSLGLKFGVHIMRGIPRLSVERNTPIKGTEYTARDIADTTDMCDWCPQNYGINMDKPGAQEFYDGWVELLASWGVDFIKADDIVPFPKEVDALVEAIEKCGRPIVLSLSPGAYVPEDGIDSFKRANMLRVTTDIWDNQIGINQCFTAWRKWQGHEDEDFYIDMDMIPFGELQIMAQKPDWLSGDESKQSLRKQMANKQMENTALFSGHGWHRQSEFDEDQQYTFITLRSLSASPLIIGGDLVSMDEFSYSLLINKDMIECNQNGVMGSLIYDKAEVEGWKSVSKSDPKSGWIGFFNRSTDIAKSVTLDASTLSFKAGDEYALYNIWADSDIEIGASVKINPNGVLFLKYRRL